MRLRQRLVATMVGVVAVGLIVVDLITLTSLHSYLYGRVDSQLATAAHEVAALTVRAQTHHRPVTATEIRERVSPDVYVELLDPKGVPDVVKPSGSSLQADPPPDLPDPLPVRPLPPEYDLDSPAQVYRPAQAAVTVDSFHRSGHHRRVVGTPQYRMLAVSLPGQTLVVATRLDSVTATLGSLRVIEIGLTIGLLVLLAVLITAILRRGLRPLEDMSREADAIAAGDLTRRVQPSDGTTEISRLGRALNGMLTQIETAFAQRATSEERLRSFLADASHELRTPLTSIQGYAELLRKDALPDPAARDRALVRIEQEAARMGALVGDLSVLAREGEGPAPELVRVDLAGVAAEVVRDARVIDGSRHIELDCPRAVPVLGGPAQLEQLVHNLVGNALAHTPSGTPVEVGVWVDGDRAVLEVRDHGPGMDAAQAARVFDRFFRGSSAGRGGGSGLGLFIVASLARTFGGEATVTSTPGEGSTFTVVLPIDGGATRPPPDRAAGRSPGSRPGGGGTQATPGTPGAPAPGPGSAPTAPDSRTGHR
ncbi:MAG: HAMP domain-containing sensor histidine kinase [Acidimicrobiales bacterium]|jgi:two-component system OmpR family sensor kinase